MKVFETIGREKLHDLKIALSLKCFPSSSLIVKLMLKYSEQNDIYDFERSMLTEKQI